MNVTRFKSEIETMLNLALRLKNMHSIVASQRVISKPTLISRTSDQEPIVHTQYQIYCHADIHSVQPEKYPFAKRHCVGYAGRSKMEYNC